MPASRKRVAIENKSNHAQKKFGSCDCLKYSSSNGLCDLNVWQGTIIDKEAMVAGEKLLKPSLPIVKYRDCSLFRLSGHLYHLVVLRWSTIFALFIGVYVLVVFIFALFFMACDASPGVVNSKIDYYFNLSLQTLATIGYGVLYPGDTCSNWISVAESFVGLLMLSFMTGVAFVKFARPQSNLVFSKIYTVSERENGELEMRFRVLNGTRRTVLVKGEILEAAFKLILMRVEQKKDGNKVLCYYDLNLKTSNFIAVRLEVELVHYMDEYSPFYKMSLNDIKNSDFLLILMMSGVDENLHDMIHQQHEYTQHDMLWGARFSPMLSWDSHHKFIDLDFDKLSQTVAAPISSLPDVAVIDMEESNLSDRVVAADEDTQVYQTLTNVAGEDEEIDLNRLHHEGAASGTRQSENGDEADSISNADLELSTLERQQSGSSTHTNSGSEDDGLKNSQSQHHRIRFDQRSRTNSFRVHQLLSSHLARPGHSHGITHDMSNQPLSLARSRIRFKNHPLLRVFSNGVYYQALEMTWSFLFILLIFVYLAVIAIVALLLYLYPGDVLLETDNLEVHHDYMRMFFFCAQTITTIGYGILSPLPNNIFVNFFVFVLVIIGVCISTLLTGITWAKFSIPKASTLLYSDNLLLTSFHGHRALMFRVANNRTFGLIIEGSFRVSVVVLNRQLARKETHELKLIRNVWPIVQLGNTVTHIIDEESPLYKLSVDQILDGDIFFVVLFTGLDSVVGENMFSRKTYHSCDILVGHHFADNIKLAMDGLHFDLNAINETVLTPEEDLRKTQLYADRVSEAFKDESDENNSVEDERFTKVNSRTSLFVRSTGTSSFGNGSVNADDNDCDDTGIPPIDEIGWSTPKITKYTDIMSPIDSYFSRI